MSGTFLCSASWHGKHKARVRYICVGHEKSSIIPIWQRRKVRPTSERNVPKVTEPSSPSGSKTNSMECTLHSTNQPVWCQMVYKAVCLSITDLIQLWSRVESQNGSTCVAPDFCLQCPNSGKALPGFQPLRTPWLVRERGVTWFFTRGSMMPSPDSTCGVAVAPTSHSGWTSSKRPQLPQQDTEEPWASSQPSAHRECWQAGSDLGLPGQGWALGNGSQAAKQGPPDSLIQVLLSSLHEGRVGLGPRSSHNARDGRRFPFLSCPDSSGLPSWPFRVGPDEESSVNSAHPANKSQDVCLEAEIAPSVRLFFGG